jgi:regulator of protease activity HflC (stomatin/prohibitin superfamily)
MNPSLLILFLVIFVIISYLLGSIKVINEGNVAIVERLGRYARTLKSGVNFISPILESIVLEESTREKILDIAQWTCVTKDQVSIYPDSLVYWRIINVRRAYYEVEDLEEALNNLVINAINREIEKREIKNILISKEEVTDKLKKELNQSVDRWGIEITNLVILEIQFSDP